MIHSILEDRKGTIWFCTNAGLFSNTNNRLMNVSDKVGIPTNFVSKIVEDKKGDSGFLLQLDFSSQRRYTYQYYRKAFWRE
ncbi:MAG: hypothetical protein IPG12_03840 [Saprospiraceae bacterium]|nr:hypothetical protein [Saprospiraceae bacterium]